MIHLAIAIIITAAIIFVVIPFCFKVLEAFALDAAETTPTQSLASELGGTLYRALKRWMPLAIVFCLPLPQLWQITLIVYLLVVGITCLFAFAWFRLLAVLRRKISHDRDDCGRLRRPL